MQEERRSCKNYRGERPCETHFRLPSQSNFAISAGPALSGIDCSTNAENCPFTLYSSLFTLHAFPLLTPNHPVLLEVLGSALALDLGRGAIGAALEARSRLGARYHGPAGRAIYGHRLLRLRRLRWRRLVDDRDLYASFSLAGAPPSSRSATGHGRVNAGLAINVL